MNTNCVRLKGTYDIERLQRDLKLAASLYESAPQVGKYHDGSWTGISLRNFSGDHTNTLAAHTGNSKDTEVLKSCHYFKEILDDLGCPVYVARILFLPPGKVIGEHVDSGFGWNYGMVRLHIPIITDPRVEFTIGEEDVYWKPGEFWFGDFGKPHSLRNKSDITRVHLVIDCPITAETLKLFPEAFLQAVRAESNILEINGISLAEDELKKYEGTLVLNGPLLGMNLPITANVFVDEGMLAVKIRGIPLTYHFTPVANQMFQCNTYTLMWAGNPEVGKQCEVLVKESKSDKSQQVTVYKSEPFAVRLFSYVQRTILGVTWRLYFATLKLKRSLGKSKHVTEQTPQ